jgi:hypothetical protein
MTPENWWAFVIDPDELQDAFRAEIEASKDLKSALRAVAFCAIGRAQGLLKAKAKTAAPAPAARPTLQVAAPYTPTPEESLKAAEAVIAAVARDAGISVSVLVSATRVLSVARARYVAMALLRSRGIALTTTARLLGRKDHATVSHGLNQVEAHPELKAAFDRLHAELFGNQEGRAAA